MFQENTHHRRGRRASACPPLPSAHAGSPLEGVTRRQLRRQRRALAAQRSRAVAVSVAGELILTVGVVVLLFVAWQMWVGDVIMSSAANDHGHQVTQEWANAPVPSLPPAAVDAPESYEPPVMPAPADGVPWGAQMRVPRFGADYNVTIAGGVSRARTLDHGWIGVYPDSGMPGQVGNFSMAAHRTTWGKPFNLLDTLRVDDAIVIETAEGWYTYRFRTLEYVTPDSVDVLAATPQGTGPDGGRYITLTACSPLFSLAERIVAYGVFDSFQPRALGAPASLQEVTD